MDNLITYLIYTHALFGGIGLITGIISALAAKGLKTHRLTGKLFSFSMLVSSIVSLIVSLSPKHENPFLFLIGIFTIYMVLAGNNALKLKSKNEVNWKDKIVSRFMFFTSIIMILIGVVGTLKHIENSILFVFFGGFGLFMTLKDFQTFKKINETNSIWLKSHLGRMLGALIASITAFMVVGLHLTSIFAWITPSIIGTCWIIYNNRRLEGIKNADESK